MDKSEKHSKFIKEQAYQLGFDACGIAKADFLEEDAKHLTTWLQKGYHGQMSYMENHFDKRLDPRKLVPGAKSVISLMYNYYPDQQQRSDSYKISKYAYNEDYHLVIKKKLFALLDNLREAIGEIDARVFTDSAPVMERTWAQKSGLGWIGKHSLLISKKKGSFFFLAEIICDLELAYDLPFTSDHCGNCTRCVDACPTDAILPDQTIDGSKCISYFTIELKDAIPNSFKGQFDDWMFGCDICQDVCPWNRFSTPHQEEKFLLQEAIANYSKKEWEELSEDSFHELFNRSPVKRTGYSGLMRNIDFIKNQRKDHDSDQNL